jgi:hypothetical protein
VKDLDMPEFFDETWLDENARLCEERVKFWKNIRFQLLCAGAGILLFLLFFGIAWIGTALND